MINLFVMQIRLPEFNLKLYFALLSGVIFLNQGCAVFTVAPDSIIEDNYYDIRHPEITDQKIYVEDAEDSIVVYLFHKRDIPDELLPESIKDTIVLPARIPEDQYMALSFKSTGFDLDLLSFLFKFRPAREDMHHQLNAELSGVLYAGYRRDIYSVDYSPALPGKMNQQINHTGFSFGAFSGFGSTFMTPWVTSGAIDSEYDAVVWTNGVAALMATPNINVALGVGIDYLLDGNRNYWIYQNKPWFGFAVGIDLN